MISNGNSRRVEDFDGAFEASYTFIDGGIPTNGSNEGSNQKKRTKSSDDIEENEQDEDMLFMKSLIPSLKRITDPYTKSVVKMNIMKFIHEAVYNNQSDLQRMQNMNVHI